MSENSKCVVCGSVMLSGYRGRPRLTCSPKCKNARRVIRARNQSELELLRLKILHMAHVSTPWPSIQSLLLQALAIVSETSSEVVPGNLRTVLLEELSESASYSEDDHV
jgi:hypothetical protein